MKRILILAYDFPPHTSVAAARPSSWFRYFKTHGMQPVVVTRHWDLPLNSPEDTLRKSKNQKVSVETDESGTIIRVPHHPWQRHFGFKPSGPAATIRKMISFLISVLRYTSFWFEPDKKIYLEARNYLLANKTDCILATGEPFYLFRFASGLSKEFGVPWIADYRDGWSQNQLNVLQTGIPGRIKQWSDRFQERRISSTATAITAAAPSYLQSVLSVLNKPILNKVIYNGYEEAPGSQSHQQVSPDLFTIAYSGRLYPHYPLEEFIQALAAFQQEFPENRIQLHCLGLAFYPDEVKRIEKAAQDTGLLLKLSHRLAYPEYMAELRKARLCLLFGVPGISWLNAKIFDYFYAGRKVMLYRNDHAVLESLINLTNSGFCCNNASELNLKLKELYTEFNETGDVACNPVHIEQFSRKNQAFEMTELIKKCVE